MIDRSQIMSLYTGDYGDYNSSGNVLYGGYNADKVATSPEFESALNRYAEAKMWSEQDKTGAKNAAMKLVYLPALRRKRYASTSKDDRRFYTAQIRALTANMTPIDRKHGMQLLREATGARLRPRVSLSAKQAYNAAFVEIPMNDYKNWMSPAEFAQGVPNGLYTPNPRPPVKPSQKRIAHNILQRYGFAAAGDYVKTHTWAKPYVGPLVAAALKIGPIQNPKQRESMYKYYANLYSYMGPDVEAALNAIVIGISSLADRASKAAAVSTTAAASPSSTAAASSTSML